MFFKLLVLRFITKSRFSSCGKYMVSQIRCDRNCQCYCTILDIKLLLMSRHTVISDRDTEAYMCSVSLR